MSQQSILIIGYGKMGEAIAASLKLFNLHIIDPALTQKKEGSTQFYNDASQIPNDASFDYVMLAIKPQIVKNIAPIYQKHLNKNNILISILAGKSLAEIASIFGVEQKIVRLMPNLAAKFGKSTTTGCHTNNINNKELEEISSLCSSFGNVTWLKNEELMHISTAINGSGPAFFAYIIKAFTEHAESYNLNKNSAESLILDTMENTIEIIRNGTTPEELMTQVASKGGTTEAMLNSLTNLETDKIIQKTIDATISRSKSL